MTPRLFDGYNNELFASLLSEIAASCEASNTVIMLRDKPVICNDGIDGRQGTHHIQCIGIKFMAATDQNGLRHV